MRNNNLNEAEFCRQNGLRVGDVLRAVEGNCVDTVRISAIGEKLVLCVWNEKREASTTFSCRDWEKVENNHVPERTNMRKITDHVVNPCNDKLIITVTDEPGAGGANHAYVVHGMDPSSNPGLGSLSVPGVDTAIGILFQNGPIPEKGVNGLTHEVLLAIVADRLRSFQAGPFACRENALALTKIEEAMHWLQQRTLARMRRGVEGTHTV